MLNVRLDWLLNDVGSSALFRISHHGVRIPLL
jgi:hypothetical protein